MTLQDAIARFDDLNAQSRIPNRKTGGFRRLSSGERNVVVSHVTNAVSAATGGGDPMATTLAPYLEVLVDAVRADAKSHGRYPNKEVSSVRLFLSAVEGCEYKVQRRVIRDAILPEWLALYDALTELRDGNENRRTPRSRRYPAYLYGFQNFFIRRGVSAPGSLPDYETLVRWAQEDGLDRKKLDNFLCAYRAARTASGKLDLPDLAPPTAHRHRGLLGLPDIDEILARAAEASPAAAGFLQGRQAHDVPDQLELVRVLAPLIWEATDAYLAQTSKSDAWYQQVSRTTSCLVAELLRMGFETELADLDHLDLFERLVDFDEGGVPVVENGLLKRRLGSGSGPVQVSLFRAYIDRAARTSFRRSPIQLMASSFPEHEVPWYTDTSFNESSAIWSVTEFVYGKGMGRPEGGLAKLRPTEWKKIRLEYETVREHMKSINGRRRSRGHKNKGLIDFTWAQAICQGIPFLWTEVQKLRQRYYLVKAERGEEAPVTRKARRRYFRYLEDLVIYTIFLDDGLRVANYCEGLANVHFIPEVKEGRDRKWSAIVGCRTKFRGYDAQAGLKIEKTSDGRERDRVRDVTPGIVDMELLSEFWLLARVQTLVTLGFIPSEDDYTPSEDRWAFFLSPMSTREDGGYSPGAFSKRFGRILHRVMKHALKRAVPEWGQLSGTNAVPELKRQWRGIFNAHVTRLLIATYVGGLRRDWPRASWLTNDQSLTLERHYMEVKGIFQDAMTKKGVEHPRHFDELVDRLWEGEVVDWGSFDPHHPSTAVTVSSK